MRKSIFVAPSLGVIYILPELSSRLREEKGKNLESDKKDGGRIIKVKIRGSS